MKSKRFKGHRHTNDYKALALLLSCLSPAASGENTVISGFLWREPSKPPNCNMSSSFCWRHLSLTDLGLNAQPFDVSPFALSCLTGVYLANENQRWIYSRSNWLDHRWKLVVIWSNWWGFFQKFSQNKVVSLLSFPLYGMESYFCICCCRIIDICNFSCCYLQTCAFDVVHSMLPSTDSSAQVLSNCFSILLLVMFMWIYWIVVGQ